jgi:hypothetical protein
MTKPDNDPIDKEPPFVPVGVFMEAASGIEFALSELIDEIALAATYTGDDAIVYAVEIIATTHTLQSYLFAHFDELIREKKMKTHAEQADKK